MDPRVRMAAELRAAGLVERADALLAEVMDGKHAGDYCTISVEAKYHKLCNSVAS